MLKSFELTGPKSRSALIAAFAVRSFAMQAHGHACEEPSAPYWHLMSQDERDKAAASGEAMPDGSYPITTCDGENSVDTAIHAVGRGGADHDAIRKHVMTRAKSLGCASKIPENWNDDGSLAAASAAPKFAADAEVAPSQDPGGSTTPAQPTDGGDTVDSEMEAAIATLEEAYQKAVDVQAKDPDIESDPNDAAVAAKLTAIKPLLDELKAAQQADSASEPAPTSPDGTKSAQDASDVTPDAKLAVINTTPELTSTDEDGKVKPDLVCATDGCGHKASSHADLEMGENTGPCSMANCYCEGFTFANASAGNQSSDGGAPNNAGGDDSAPATDGSLAADSRGGYVVEDGSAGSGDDSTPPADSGFASPDLNEAPFVEGSENMGPAFTIPVGIIMGQLTDDGRAIQKDSLSWKNGPWALMAKLTSTHDPNGMDTDDPAILVGRIDTLAIVAGEADTQVVEGHGFFFPDPESMEVADKLEGMGKLPVSGDVLVTQSVQTVDEAQPFDDFGFPNVQESVTEGEIQAFTILPFGPAFGGCYIVLGDGSESESTVPPQQTDEQMPMTASAQVIHWLSRAACVPCETKTDVLVASGGPVRPPKAWFENPNFQVDDGRMMPFVGRGARGMISGFTVPPTVTEEGEVYGYIAPWGACHIGKPGCVVAPHSASNYAHFKRGQHVLTAEGEYVRVGTITAHTGHADMKSDALAAMAHYDNTALQACDVNIGEDEHGIWYHGALRPEATEAQIRMLRASGISGDWRGFDRDLELVAALAVNSPGFAAALVEDGKVRSLVAAGSFDIFEVGHPGEGVVASSGSSDLSHFSDGPLRRLYRRDSLERIGQLTESVVEEAKRKIDALA